MCVVGVINGVTVENVGEMKAVVGSKIVFFDGEEPDNTCLCCVNVDATAKSLGAIIDRDTSGDFSMNSMNYSK